jgi:hypothetical protein
MISSGDRTTGAEAPLLLVVWPTVVGLLANPPFRLLLHRRRCWPILWSGRLSSPFSRGLASRFAFCSSARGRLGSSEPMGAVDSSHLVRLALFVYEAVGVSGDDGPGPDWSEVPGGTHPGADLNSLTLARRSQVKGALGREVWKVHRLQTGVSAQNST